MKFYIIIPAHNEGNTLKLTLNSLVNETKLPKKLVVVNDSSNDETGQIISFFTEKYDWIKSTTKFQNITPNPRLTEFTANGRHKRVSRKTCGFRAKVLRELLETFARKMRH